MSDWSKVRWTQACQIVELIDPDSSTLPATTITPQDHFSSLRQGGKREEAITFLGVALPRLDAIGWSIRSIIASAPAIGPKSASARTAIEAWLRDPNDGSRRDAWEAGNAAPTDSPERLLGHAVFFSGGSIAPPDLAAVHPDPDLTGKLAAAAIICAAYRQDDPQPHLEKALSEGEAFARGAH